MGDGDLFLLGLFIVKMIFYNFVRIIKLRGELNRIDLLSLMGKSYVDMIELMN